MADKFVKVRFFIEAEIGSVKFDDIVSMSSTFGLNSIPTASLIVAVGYDHKRKKLATIHEFREQLKHRDPARVWLTIRYDSGDESNLHAPDNVRFKIFEGYLAGIGYQRSHNSANYTLSLIHWLDDLNNSSAVNGNWFPGSNYDLAQNALYGAVGSANDQSMVIPDIDSAFNIVTIANLQEDMWGKIIKPIFEKVAKFEKADVQSDNTNAVTNSAAVGPTSLGPGALERMPNGAPTYVPPKLDLTGLDGSFDIAYSVREALIKNQIKSFEYSTFWSKLIGEYASQFFFAVSPSIEWALPVPFFAGLKTHYIEIQADEYSYANFNAAMNQMLESVDIFYPVGLDPNIGGLGTWLGAPGLQNALGTFPKTPSIDQMKQGLKLYKEPPMWLTNAIADCGYSIRTTGEGAPPPGDQAAPDHGDKQPPPRWKTPKEVLDKLKAKSGAHADGTPANIVDRLAEHWYKTELLYQRYGEMSGALRFDIAPGSIVKIETPPRDLEWYGAKDHYMFATVTQVSYVINAEKATAGTSFTLAHLRTEAENNNNQITAEKPPLFLEAWPGGPLANFAGQPFIGDVNPGNAGQV